MNQRWSISDDDGATWVFVSPLNGSKGKIDKTRDLGSGQVFFRKKLNGTIDLGGDDFLYLDAKRRRPSLRCQELLIRVEFLCGTWKEYWRGKFSAGSIRWDLAGCIVSVKAETVDRYTCLLENKDVKRNILQAPIVDASFATIPSLEFGTCTTIGFNPFPLGGCDEFFGPFGIPGDPFINGWDGAGAQAAPGPSQVNFYWRERVETECVGGSPVPPPGVGWVLITDDCVASGTAVYARQPIIAWPFDPPSAGSVVDGVNVPPAGDCNWVFMGMGGLDDPFTPDTEELPYYVCIDSATQTALPRARTLQSATEYIIEQAGCDLAGVRSDFFDWNAPGDAPGYVAGENYVTGAANQMNALVILQKTDVIDPAASNPATIGEMTFAEMMTFLRVAHRCYWDIDDDGYVRIEHWSYWVFAVGLDLVAADRPNEPLVFESIGEEIQRIERARWMEAQGRDFVGKDIVYDSPCVPNGAAENVREWSPGRITTDVSFIDSDPDAISKDGFVVLATTLVSGVYQTIIDTGAITGNFTSNAPMSWANLQRDFWTYDRYLPSANMNGQDTVFDAYLPNVKQEPATIAMCCEVLAFDPKSRVEGALSRRLGTAGHVESASLDLYDQRLTLVLRYAY